jgi:hypothetical protein
MAHHGVATEDFFRASLPADTIVEEATDAAAGTQADRHSANSAVPGLLQDVFFDVAGNAAVHLEHAVSSAHMPVVPPAILLAVSRTAPSHASMRAFVDTCLIYG